MARKGIAVPDHLPQRPRLEQCGWPSCTSEADCRMLAPTGWLPLCPGHYNDYWRYTPLQPTDPNGFRDRNKLEEQNVGKSYRERRYKSKGLPYEPPKVVDSPPFRCVGVDMNKLEAWSKAHGFSPKVERQREPGED